MAWSSHRIPGVGGAADSRFVRRLPAFAALSLGILLSLSAFFLVRAYEEQEIATHIGHSARDAHHAIARELVRDADAVTALGHFFESSEEVGREEFHRFTAPTLGDHPEIQGLGWAPRVPAGAHDAFEQRVRGDGRAGFRIRGFDGEPPRTGTTAYPVLFTAPVAGNGPAVGRDLASEPVRRAALEAARDSGEVQITAPITLVQQNGDAAAYLLFHPVYAGEGLPETIAERRQRLAGVAVGAYRVADLLEVALHPEQWWMFDIVLHDVTGGERRLIAVQPAPGRTDAAVEAADSPANPFAWAREVKVPGRTWHITAVPTPEFVAAHARFDAWLVLAAGLLLSLGLAYHLFQGRRRFALIERAHREWRDAFDAVPDPIFLHDGDGRILRANRAYAEHAGRALPEVLGRPYWEVFPRTAGPAEGCSAAGGTDVDANLEEWVTDHGRSYHARYFPIRDSAGDYHYSVHLLEDVTDRVQAEAAIRAEQERARSYLDIASVLIVALDAEGRITLINRAGCELLGYDEEELVGAAWLETAIPPEWRERIGEVFRNNVGGDVHHRHVENPVLTRSGEERMIAWQNAPITGPDGEVAGTLSSGLDITERREWELRLQASEERLQLALEGARDGLWDWDVRNDRVYFSPRWKQLLGYADEEISDAFEEWRSRVHPDDLPAAEAAVQAHFKSEEPYLSNEFRMRHKDGHWVWVLARSRLIRDEEGRPVRMVGTHVDVTDIREAQRREAEARAGLQERVKELRCMYGVAELAFDLERPWRDVLHDVVRLLPQGWLRPERTVARILWEGEAIVTDGFTPSDHEQEAVIRTNGEERGRVQVFVHGGEAATGRPFLDEEMSLIDRVAQELGHAVELREKEAALERINRVLLTLSESNRSLVRATTEAELTHAMCDVLVANGDYALAWVGYSDEQGGGLRQVAAATAPDIGELAQMDIPAAADGPLVHQALETGRTQIVEAAEDASCPVCSTSTPACRSSIALPLVASDTAFGVLAVCSADPHGMNAQEVELFEELAGDLAYGVNTMRTRDQRDRAVTAYDELLFQTIEAIARTVEKRDPYTAGHQQRVAELAAAIGTELGWAEDRVRGLRLGATIHDLDKVYIPAEILNRPGRLSAQEFSLIQTHPDVGYDIIQGVDFPWPVAEMIRQHHERLDGSGYPKGLTGDAVIPEARVLAVADVVEAVTAHRPYRAGLGLDKALEVIREGRGTLFAPEVVDACTRLFEEERFVWAGTG